MEATRRFCATPSRQYNAELEQDSCDYSPTPNVITGIPPRGESFNERMMNPRASFLPIVGTIVDVETEYFNRRSNCISNYNLTVQTDDGQEVHFIVNANTYYVDCITQKPGQRIIGFYDTSAPMPLIYPPRYIIKVLALDLQNRFVNADFYDCYLVSSNQSLQLVISNNTYIIDESGHPYCGNISNRYMVALYSQFTEDSPIVTTPYVLVVLH
ncbi:hypothetical protein [Anaerosporobacter faecicola]|uniref:hypothetical protein n=1 Tax=Anaerosporobacter faecicola TaxID=2718714 RepID=UPI00143C9481|nr:hypothetical protein [Anaerosporobacter faecicola]